MFKTLSIHTSLLSLSLALITPALASETTESLDRPYKAQKGIVTGVPFKERLRSLFDFQPPFALPKMSDVKAMLEIMTPVKSQGHRGTCSIFSMTALMESEMMRNFGSLAEFVHSEEYGDLKTVNLSEQWLAYLVVKNNGDEGSEAYINLDLISTNGMASERVLPYNEDSWDNLESSREAQAACGHLKSTKLKMCLLAQKDTSLIDLSAAELQSKDPELYGAYRSALLQHSKYLKNMGGVSSLNTEIEVKKLLAAGIPVIAEMDFYYGAWNHREAVELGIQRSSELFAQGVVGYPAVGSVDRAKSTVGKAAAGHSILLVGYDDEKEVTVDQKMMNGEMKTFTYKGVYYFKNSWGTDRFGTEMSLNGRTPGYGMITQAYANEFAAFYKFPWK